MTKLITSLTPGQLDKLPAYRDKWTKIGLSCEPLDYDRAVDAATRAYAVAGLEPPKRWVVCDSPLSGATTAALLKSGDSVWASVWASVRVLVWASVRASVWDSVWDSVRASVMMDSVWDSVRASVMDSVMMDSVWDSVRASVMDSVWDSVYGAHDASWLGVSDFFLTELGVSEIEPLRPLIDMAQHCGWWIPYRDVCVLQHRHSELHRDEQGRLHHPSGMAVAYRDGWGVYAWHGLRVPERIITTVPTAAMVMKEDNSEYKRVLIERMGAETFLAHIHADLAHQDEFGRLWRADIGDGEPLTVVEVVNGTPNPDGSPKVYWLTVPHHNDLRGGAVMATAREAVAWSYGLLPEQYAPAVRT